MASSGSSQSGTELSGLAAALQSCSDCSLAATRTTVVYGVGNPDADLLFVGEAPGFHEDRQGEPFVGQAGKLLDELLAGIGLSRGDVYIANVLKCRPPNNRDPRPDEIECCKPNLYEQIRLIRPRVICTLGRFATRLLGQTEASMSAVRGRAKELEIAGVPVIVFPVFHPAAALYTPLNREHLEADFRKLRLLLDRGSRALPEGEVTETDSIAGDDPNATGPSAGDDTDTRQEPEIPVAGGAGSEGQPDHTADQLSLW